VGSIEGVEMGDWKLKAGAMLVVIDELRHCFTNMDAVAKSLDEKIQGCEEASLKAPVREIIRIAKEMEGKLSRFYHACELLAQSCDYKANLSDIASEPLPGFREYVRMKYSVELDEDLVTMIEDLIERQQEKVKLAKHGAR
jgi:hypothetical protein